MHITSRRKAGAETTRSWPAKARAPEIWSLGHRNVQGAALNPQTGAALDGRARRPRRRRDQRPQAGRNYGWPVITYGVDYSGAKIGEGTAKAGNGAAGLLLGSLDRARPAWPSTPATSFPPGRAASSSARSPAAAGAARNRRRQGHRRGAHAARARRAHPRRPPGPGRATSTSSPTTAKGRILRPPARAT